MKYPSSILNKTFTIPYNNDPELIKGLVELLPNPRPFNVYIYFAPNSLITNAGRKFPNLERYVDEKGRFKPIKFDRELMSTLKEAKKYGFKTNLLLNNILLGMPHFNIDLKEDIPKIQRYLEQLNSKGCLDRVTIGNPYLLELINWSRLSEVEVKTSVNFQIKKFKTIELLNNLSDFWLEKPMEGIEIQKDLLRDLGSLKKIRKKVGKRLKLSIIVNEGCLNGCPYQIAHQVHAASFPSQKDSSWPDQEFQFNTAKCWYVMNQEPWRALDANWILPKDIIHYKDIVDEFKLTDRRDTTEGVLEVVRAYIFNDYDKKDITPLISLLRSEKFAIPESVLPSDFFEKVSSQKEIPASYFKNLWSDVEDHNLKLGNISKVQIKARAGKSLHKYIGNEQE